MLWSTWESHKQSLLFFRLWRSGASKRTGNWKPKTWYVPSYCDPIYSTSFAKTITMTCLTQQTSFDCFPSSWLLTLCRFWYLYGGCLVCGAIKSGFTIGNEDFPSTLAFKQRQDTQAIAFAPDS
jgi:hypothetical protein